VSTLSVGSFSAAGAIFCRGCAGSEMAGAEDTVSTPRVLYALEKMVTFRQHLDTAETETPLVRLYFEAV
jgi:hypothetical protein